MIADIWLSLAIGYLVSGLGETARLLSGPRIERTMALARPTTSKILVSILIWPVIIFLNSEGPTRIGLPITSVILFSAIAWAISYLLSFLVQPHIAWGLLFGCLAVGTFLVIKEGRRT